MLEAQLRPFGLLTMDAVSVHDGDRVLDVGCGSGDSTRELARRAGPNGHVRGVDLSGPMLERARVAGDAEGFTTLEFVHADAQTAALGTDWDLVFSRFGVMFFDDPVAAFANLRSALSTDGRLGFVCWCGPDENDHLSRPRRVVARHVALPPAPRPGEPGPQALADPTRLRTILGDAGFTDVQAIHHAEDMVVGGPGSDLRTSAWLMVRNLLNRAGVEPDPPVMDAILDELTADLAADHGPDGLLLPAAVWVVIARPG